MLQKERSDEMDGDRVDRIPPRLGSDELLEKLKMALFPLFPVEENEIERGVVELPLPCPPKLQSRLFQRRERNLRKHLGADFLLNRLGNSQKWELVF